MIFPFSLRSGYGSDLCPRIMTIIELWFAAAGELTETDDVEEEEDTDADIGEDLVLLLL